MQEQSGLTHSTTEAVAAAEAAAAATTTRRASLKFIFAPVSNNMPPPSTTNKIILDYLLYLSIQSRLKQAQIELLELATPLQDKDNDAIQVRQERWVATATKAEQDKNAVESIVTGILSSHRNKRPSFQVDSHFEQRLHLCQLTNLIFGRLDTVTNNTNQYVITQSSSSSSSSNRRRRRRYHQYQHQHQHETAVDQENTNDNDDNNDTTNLCRWSHMIKPSYCRRHRLQRCVTCCQDNNNNNNSNKNSSPLVLPPGLVEAIPTFLKTSADMLRQTLEATSDDDNEQGKQNGDDNNKKPLIFAGQKVMGGGMPPRWYDLFLELLTQAAIERYLCDMQTGLESIYEIFSYGDVEDEDEPDTPTHQHNHGNDDDEEDDDEEDDVEDDDWGVKAADHHLLFPKTRTMYLFKTQVREREKEFLDINKDISLHDHFSKLAKRYPLENFEKNIGEFIQMIHNTMAIPALDNKYDDNDQDGTSISSSTTTATTSSTVNNPATSPNTTAPSVYKYPGDGSLLMPEIPDDEDEVTSHSNKRRASVDLVKDDNLKRQC
ncbi:hypothetical protein BC941DRAFT_432119 [Chlamydoabsidia padenii]|nr:hypothetical protein BC941DRAFT_432119 [Chlamydoabsidia padenii]